VHGAPGRASLRTSNGCTAVCQRKFSAREETLTARSKVPAVRLTRCYLRRDPQGELLGSCPKVPSDLEAKVGYYMGTKDHSNKELVFGYSRAYHDEIGQPQELV